MLIGAVNLGATVTTLHRVSKAGNWQAAAIGQTRAVMHHEAIGRRTRMLRCRVHAVSPGTKIVHLWALVSKAGNWQAAAIAATTLAVTHHEAIGRRTRMLRCRVHAVSPGTKIVHLWALVVVPAPHNFR
jgi:hypothetical protein